jgi:peptidoglycan/LPS O-acetylase OafA/YrhL
MKYRPEIDGLRALAIVPVLIYHLNNSLMPYGYIGVDIFFLISGYLISTIISEKLKNKSFSIIEFYERRIKRIAPLYFLIIFISIPFAIFLLLPHQLTDFSQSIIASLFFLSNYFFYFEMDYFNPFVEYSPLIHTWSLSVEEQFYLFFPALLILLNKFNNKIKICCLSILALISMYYCYLISETNISLAFYSSLSRAWELLFGVILSFVTIKKVNTKQKYLLNILGLISLFLLFIIFFGAIKFKHPGPFTILPIILTSIIILIADKASILNKILKIPFLIHIGILSYSLYMIHQPIIAFIKVWNNKYVEGFDILELLLVITLIYVLSLASYKLYEKPIRYMKISRKKVFLSFITLTFIFSGIGYYGHISRGLKKVFIEKYGDKIKYDIEDVKNKAIETYKYGINDTILGKKKDILIIGDSMANDLVVAISIADSTSNLKTHKLRIDDPCIKHFSEQISTENSELIKCEEFIYDTEKIKKLIKNSSIIILSSLWTEQTYKDGIETAKLLFNKYDKKVFVIGPSQFSDINVISIDIAKKNIHNDSLNSFISNFHIRQDKFNVSKKMKTLSTKDIFFIDKFEFFSAKNGFSLFYKNGYPKIWDDAHLSKPGLKDYGKFILRKLND